MVAYAERVMHGLRHTSDTPMYEVTDNITNVADHLRHSDLKTAATYAKWQEGR